jgi:hypothetical protein
VYIQSQNAITNNYSIYTLNGTAVFNELGDANSDFRVESDAQPNMIFVDSSANAVGIAQGTPTARLHIGAGTTVAGTAPLKFTSGSLTTTAETGAMEYLSPVLSFTNGSATRHDVAQFLNNFMTSTQNRLNTTGATDITGLDIALPAGRTYQIEVYLNIAAVSAVGAKVEMNYTGTMTHIGTYSQLLDSTGVLAYNQTDSTSFDAQEFSVSTVTAGTFILQGTVVTSTAGTLSVQGAQSVISAVNTTFFIRGGYIKATLLA